MEIAGVPELDPVEGSHTDGHLVEVTQHGSGILGNDKK
jgi:hypothetical protein